MNEKTIKNIHTTVERVAKDGFAISGFIVHKNNELSIVWGTKSIEKMEIMEYKLLQLLLQAAEHGWLKTETHKI